MKFTIITLANIYTKQNIRFVNDDKEKAYKQLEHGKLAYTAEWPKQQGLN